MFQNIFRKRPKKFLGVDIGTSCIRVVEIGRRGQMRKLENYGETETSLAEGRPFRTFKKDTLLLSDKNIAKAVQAICNEARIRTKEVNFSIPDFCSFFTTFGMPAMSKEELSEAIRYEVRPYIPLPLSEITLDWTITEGEPSKSPLKILVVAVPNEVIAQYQEIARLSNLKLKVLEPEVFALARASIGNKKNKREKEEKKVIGLIDIGARSTTCSIFEQKILKISHSFNIAGNELTERLAKSLNIDYNKAEELKRKYGLTLTPHHFSEEKDGQSNSTKSGAGFSESEVKESQQNIRKILIPLVDSILEEIKKVFRDFYQNEGKEIEKIILTGGLALLPGLKEYLFVELKKEVVISNPFLNISYPPILKETLKEKGPCYTVAVGLALKGLE